MDALVVIDQFLQIEDSLLLNLRPGLDGERRLLIHKRIDYLHGLKAKVDKVGFTVDSSACRTNSISAPHGS